MTMLDQVKALINAEDYEAAIAILEGFLQENANDLEYYWYLGLAYLLQEKETEAQTTWLLVMSQGDKDQIEEWTNKLINILELEAIHQVEIDNLHLSWLIRGHIREIEPNLINNLLYLIDLEIQLEYYHPQHLHDWQVAEILKFTSTQDVDLLALAKVIDNFLNYPFVGNIDMLYAMAQHVENIDEFIDFLKSTSIEIAYQKNLPHYAVDITQVCLNLKPDSLALINQLFWFSSLAKDYAKMLTSAQQFLDKASSLQQKTFGYYKVIDTQVNRGAWEEAQSLLPDYANILQRMLEESNKQIDDLMKGCIHSIASPFLYLKDEPSFSRRLQNKLATLFFDFLPHWMPWSKHDLTINSTYPRKLKIAYIAHTLRRHSVGWLSRWLIYHHDPDSFHITLYLINQKEDDITENWFKEKADTIYNFPHAPQQIASQIEQDKIDILIDLDSFSHAVTCQVLALKPAPIQATWLGFDATGIPSVDYFIADPYVLPDNAQEYYQETIWRLPQTYLAVDGFEIATPTLRRENLGIDSNTIIYMTVQGGVKRHPDTIALQMQVLQQVNNSCLLIKGNADQTVVQPLFNSIAKEYGIALHRLHFLEMCPLEETHRANLSIADVILDTYPYNGATTTLEALWMELPIVTKVGKQFAARNSYTFMINAGITEGIAETDQEYVEWGIKLGVDEALRQNIHWKLRQAKKTAPLWNTRQFTREMEKAYQQMWLKYLEAQS